MKDRPPFRSSFHSHSMCASSSSITGSVDATVSGSRHNDTFPMRNEALA